MAGKKAFMLRLDPNDYSALEKWAADEFRSVNGQIEWILNKALKDAGRRRPAGEENANINQNDKTS